METVKTDSIRAFQITSLLNHDNHVQYKFSQIMKNNKS